MIMSAWGLGRKRLPYDAEVEWLESTGTQWIDTGVAGVAGLTINMRFMPVYPVTTSYQDYAGGSNGDNLAGYRIRNNLDYEQKIEIAVGIRLKNGIDIPSASMTNISITQTAAFVNGVSVLSPIGTTYPGNNLYLFAFNRNGSPFRNSKMRLASFSVDGKINLIPVRFTNELGQSEGAMYDSANPTVGMNPDGSPRTDGLYRNRGTGSFLWAEKQ